MPCALCPMPYALYPMPCVLYHYHVPCVFLRCLILVGTLGALPLPLFPQPELFVQCDALWPSPSTFALPSAFATFAFATFATFAFALAFALALSLPLTLALPPSLALALGSALPSKQGLRTDACHHGA